MARASQSEAGIVLALVVLLLAATSRKGASSPAAATAPPPGSPIVVELFRDAPDVAAAWDVVLAQLAAQYGTRTMRAGPPTPDLTNRAALAVYWSGLQVARTVGMGAMPRSMRAAAWRAAGAVRGATILSPWNLTPAQLDLRADDDVLSDLFAGWVSIIIEAQRAGWNQRTPPLTFVVATDTPTIVACAEYEVRHFQSQSGNPPNYSINILYPTNAT